MLNEPAPARRRDTDLSVNENSFIRGEPTSENTCKTLRVYLADRKTNPPSPRATGKTEGKMTPSQTPNLKMLLHLYDIDEDIDTGAGVGKLANGLKLNGWISMAKSLVIVDDSATMRKMIMLTTRMVGLDFDNAELCMLVRE